MGKRAVGGAGLKTGAQFLVTPLKKAIVAVIVCVISFAIANVLGRFDFVTVVSADIHAFRNAIRAELSLVSLYTFDSDTGQDAIDVHNGMHNGSLLNVATLARQQEPSISGIIGHKAVNGSAVAFGNVQDFQFVDRTGTVMAFVYQTSFSAQNPVFFACRNDAVGGGLRYSLHTASDASRFAVFNGLSNAIWSSLPAGVSTILNRLTHLAIVFDNGYVQMYADGSLMTNASYTLGSSTAATCQIGSSRADGLNEQWSGHVDELGIFADPLSASAIAAFFRAFLKKPTTVVRGGSFETPILPPSSWQFAPAVGTPWAWGRTAAVAYQGAPAWPSQNLVARDGTQFAVLQGNTSFVSQRIDNLKVATTYRAELWIAKPSSLQGNRVVITLTEGQPATGVVLYDSIVEIANSSWHLVSGSWVSTNSSCTLTVFGQSGHNGTVFLDLVSVFEIAHVLEGSFEQPQIVSGRAEYRPAASTWQFEGAAGIRPQSLTFLPHDGSQIGFVERNGSISQRLLWFDIGSTYKLEIWFSRPVLFQMNRVVVSLDSTVLIDTWVNETSPAWKSHSYSWRSTKNEYDLRIAGMLSNVTNATALIDSVHVEKSFTETTATTATTSTPATPATTATPRSATTAPSVTAIVTGEIAFTSSPGTTDAWGITAVQSSGSILSPSVTVLDSAVESNGLPIVVLIIVIITAVACLIATGVAIFVGLSRQKRSARSHTNSLPDNREDPADSNNHYDLRPANVQGEEEHYGNLPTAVNPSLRPLHNHAPRSSSSDDVCKETTNVNAPSSAPEQAAFHGLNSGVAAPTVDVHKSDDGNEFKTRDDVYGKTPAIQVSSKTSNSNDLYGKTPVVDPQTDSRDHVGDVYGKTPVVRNPTEGLVTKDDVYRKTPVIGFQTDTCEQGVDVYGKTPVHIVLAATLGRDDTYGKTPVTQPRPTDSTLSQNATPAC